MEDFAGHSFHTARWDYGYTGGGPDEPLTGLADKSSPSSAPGRPASRCVPPLAESAKHLYVFQRTPSAIGERGNRPTDPDFAQGLEPGWQRARMDNFQAIIWAGPSRSTWWTTGGPTTTRRVQHPPRDEGMTIGRVPAQRRGARLPDHGGAPAPGRGAGGRPGHGRDPQAVLPVPVQAALLPRRVPARVQQPQRHARRLPRRDRADHRAGPGRRREAVRGRLHHLRHRLRGRAHPAVPSGRPRDRRPRRRHPGREVGRRRRQPVRDDEPGLPQHVRHAGAGTAGGGDRQLHAAGRARGRVRRRRRRAARSSRAWRCST